MELEEVHLVQRLLRKKRFYDVGWFGTFEAILSWMVPIAFEFLCFDLFAERADEHQLFWTHAKFCESAQVLHGIAASGADESARADGYWGRAFDVSG